MRYLGLYDPRNLGVLDRGGTKNYYGIQSAARSVLHCVTRGMKFDRIAFVSDGGPVGKDEDTGWEYLAKRSIKRWIGDRRDVIAHDLSVAGSWFNQYRATLSDRRVPVVLHVHSLSYNIGFTEALAAMDGENWASFDRILSPSACGAEVVERALRAVRARNGRADGGACGPATAVCPFPVDTDAFRPGDVEGCRALLGLPRDACVVLYLGRMNPLDKADLLPLLIAFAGALERRRGEKPVLMLAGWDYAGYAEWLRACARSMGVSESVVVLSTPDEYEAVLAMRACDVFVAPHDSVQETFGISVVEALACGKPVVASEWNGFRETVRHGTTGLLVRTIMSESADDADLRAAWDGNHHGAHGMYARRVAVPPRLLTEALDALIGDRSRREEAGAAARADATARWSHAAVAERMTALFRGLLETAASESPEGRRPGGVRARRVMEEFAGYATSHLTMDSVVAPGGLARIDFSGYWSRTYPETADDVEALREIHDGIRGEAAVREIVDGMPSRTPEEVTRAVMLGLKYGWLEEAS